MIPNNYNTGDLVLPYTCHRCKNTWESKYKYSGPHIKQVCAFCNWYVKFVSPAKLPTVLDVRQLIWQVSVRNVQAINEAKQNAELPTGSRNFIDWWNVYLELRKLMIVESNPDNPIDI